MNKVRQFCFHPCGKDRLVMAWISAFCVILSGTVAVLCFFRGHWIGGGFNAFFMVWNIATFTINRALFVEWKKKQPPA